MKVALGADHAGYGLKEKIKAHLLGLGHEVLDCGTEGEAPVDYPVYGQAAAECVAQGRAERGIVICGTGIGISIAANKVTGIRAALCTDSFMARMAREHNDAQILALGARVLEEGVAFRIVDVFLAAEFAGGRHRTRVDMLC